MAPVRRAGGHESMVSLLAGHLSADAIKVYASHSVLQCRHFQLATVNNRLPLRRG
jgi:hypothetical protein